MTKRNYNFGKSHSNDNPFHKANQTMPTKAELLQKAKDYQVPTVTAKPDELTYTPEQREALDRIWALAILAKTQLPESIAQETQELPVRGLVFRLAAMGGERTEGANEATANGYGDANQWRFMRTAYWWREVKALRKTADKIAWQYEATEAENAQRDEELSELANTLEQVTNILVHRALFGSWTVTDKNSATGSGIAFWEHAAQLFPEFENPNTGMFVVLLSNQEKNDILSHQDRLNYLGAYKAVMDIAPGINAIMQSYRPLSPGERADYSNMRQRLAKGFQADEEPMFNPPGHTVPNPLVFESSSETYTEPDPSPEYRWPKDWKPDEKPMI